jgi:thiol-disulfide isomerase/thioredoxin
MKRLIALLVGTALAASLVAACGSGGKQDSGFYHYTGATKLGTLIPSKDRHKVHSFTGSLLSGKGDFSLSEYAGKVTVINFWGSWCPPCRIETPQFAQVADKYQSKGVRFVGVDIKESSRSAPQNFVSQSKVHYPNVFDESGRTALTMGNISTQVAPFTVVLDKQHRVAGVYLIRLAPADLEPLLNKLIAEN